MPFQKGNKLWEKSLQAKKENKEKIDLFLRTLAGSGMDRYAQIIDKLADGKKLTKAEEEYMNRLEGWREYVRPKLARSELTGKDGKDLFADKIYDKK